MAKFGGYYVVSSFISRQIYSTLTLIKMIRLVNLFREATMIESRWSTGKNIFPPRNEFEKLEEIIENELEKKKELERGVAKVQKLKRLNPKPADYFKSLLSSDDEDSVKKSKCFTIS